jgi:hypothetical protein
MYQLYIPVPTFTEGLVQSSAQGLMGLLMECLMPPAPVVLTDPRHQKEVPIVNILTVKLLVIYHFLAFER